MNFHKRIKYLIQSNILLWSSNVVVGIIMSAVTYSVASTEVVLWAIIVAAAVMSLVSLRYLISAIVALKRWKRQHLLDELQAQVERKVEYLRLQG